MDRATAWGLIAKSPTSSASSPGEDLPPIPNTMTAIAVVPEEYAGNGSSTAGPPRMSPEIGLSRFASIGGGSGPFASVGMEKTASASGTVGGIEWVDWYDCYKRYKDAKIRAEAAQAASSAAQSTQASPKEAASLSPLTGSSSRGTPATDQGGSRLSPYPEHVDLSSSVDASNSTALTPSTSRDELHAGPTQLRRRSASIRSNMSDARLSPSQKMASIFERPRQSSGSSTKSTDSLGLPPNLRKKKNLVTKMEGWWNAVKSNFIPESQYTPHRPSNLGGPNITPRTPSDPSSRRASDIPPLTAPQAALVAPGNIRRDSSGALRPAASHAELRNRLRDARESDDLSGMTASTSAGLPTLGVPFASEDEALPPPPIPSFHPRAPSTVNEESSIASRSSLESRRKQPGLRLELEPHVLTRGSSQQTASSGSGKAGLTRPFHSRPSEATSRSSSYGQPSYGPGLTPGVPKWDRTPSPIVAVNATAREARENKPVAPGADITIAGVRRHVTHRIDAAKIACDAKLRETIHQITKFAEAQKEEEVMIDSGHTEEAMRDYFESISDSPLVDAEESEVDMSETFSDHTRSRNGVLLFFES